MKEIPKLYQDLELNNPSELTEFVGDIIEVMVENETEENEGSRPFTYAEIRDLLEAHYDNAYAPEDRHVERKPTQREVNFALETMLSETGPEHLVIREEEGLIYSIIEDDDDEEE